MEPSARTTVRPRSGVLWRTPPTLLRQSLRPTPPQTGVASTPVTQERDARHLSLEVATTLNGEEDCADSTKVAFLLEALPTGWGMSLPESVRSQVNGSAGATVPVGRASSR